MTESTSKTGENPKFGGPTLVVRSVVSNANSMSKNLMDEITSACGNVKLWMFWRNKNSM
jgi:hypothetical protein